MEQKLTVEEFGEEFMVEKFMVKSKFSLSTNLLLKIRAKSDFVALQWTFSSCPWDPLSYGPLEQVHWNSGKAG